MILVTGGTGFVGRHLIDALSVRGVGLRVLTRDHPARARDSRVEVAVADFSDAPALVRALDGIECVVHLAARLPSANDSPTAHDWNVSATKALCEAALHAGVARFLYCSSAGVYGDNAERSPHLESEVPRPSTAYQRSKLAGETIVRETLDGRAAWCIIRPAELYGSDRPQTRAFAHAVRRKAFWLHATPNVIVHPTHVSDAVQLCTSLLEAPTFGAPIFNVAGERPVSLQEYIQLTARALNVHARQVVVPAWLGHPLAALAARTLTGAGARVPAVVERASRRCVDRSLDTTLAKRVLSFEPVELERGLRETFGAMVS